MLTSKYQQTTPPSPHPGVVVDREPVYYVKRLYPCLVTCPVLFSPVIRPCYLMVMTKFLVLIIFLPLSPPLPYPQSVNPPPSRVNLHISCSSTPDCSSRVPTPALIDLDPVEDDVPSSPPRPNGYLTSIPPHLPTLEAVVVLSDCTAVNSNAPSSVSPHSPNSSPPPNPPPLLSQVPRPP
jgi:hypothetical protein